MLRRKTPVTLDCNKCTETTLTVILFFNKNNLTSMNNDRISIFASHWNHLQNSSNIQDLQIKLKCESKPNWNEVNMAEWSKANHTRSFLTLVRWDWISVEHSLHTYTYISNLIILINKRICQVQFHRKYQFDDVIGLVKISTWCGWQFYASYKNVSTEAVWQ